MSWRVAKSLIKLRDQLNAAVPARSRRNDGTIGDAAHAARSSDHNPWVKDGKMGVVTAEDLTNDPGHGVISRHIAEAILASRDPRVKYVISNRQIASGPLGPSPWKWRVYNGTNPHTEHVHVSVRSDKSLYDDVRNWALPPELESRHPPVGPSDQLEPPAVVSFPYSGKGSWYSQNPPEWVDREDRPNSNALGVPDAYQGVSFYDRSTLGKWFLVQAPNGKRSIEQQTDIGPNPRTGRKIDISAAAAPRFGYTPKTFPTDGVFKWKLIEVPADIANLDPKLQAVRFLSARVS